MMKNIELHLARSTANSNGALLRQSLGSTVGRAFSFRGGKMKFIKGDRIKLIGPKHHKNVGKFGTIVGFKKNGQGCYIEIDGNKSSSCYHVSFLSPVNKMKVKKVDSAIEYLRMAIYLIKEYYGQIEYEDTLNEVVKTLSDLALKKLSDRSPCP